MIEKFVKTSKIQLITVEKMHNFEDFLYSTNVGVKHIRAIYFCRAIYFVFCRTF